MTGTVGRPHPFAPWITPRLLPSRRPRLAFRFAITAPPRCNQSLERPPMGSADQSVLTPRERDELERMLNTLVRVKEAITTFEAGELNLRDAVCRMAALISDGRAT